jgi:eukaryotic-like serine/threonine-protein kinase
MSEMIGGRYRLEQQLGAGAMAEVWLAVDSQLGRHVALKLLRADADPARFEREAHAVASLSHPNICRLYDYGSEAGRPFMVFEHMPGGTLEERLGTGEPLSDSETQEIATEVAAGLAHAHDRGLIHRDLKPANVLFDEEGRAKISDFGIARLAGVDTLTEAGTLIGTAAYMSPEQASGEPASPASDVYSFGVILYRMLTGRLPFETASPVDLLRRQQYEAPPAIHSLRPDAPMVLAAVAEESLAKSPAERPPDGRALVGLLSGALVPMAADTRTQVLAPTQVLAQPGSRRRPWLIAALIGVPLLLIAGIALALVAADDGSNSPAPASTPSSTVTTAPPPPPPPLPPPPPPPVPPPPPPTQPPPPPPP